MKRLLTLSCLLIFAFFAQAQNTYQVVLTGTLTDDVGGGIPNANIDLTVDSTFFGSGWTYTSTVVTDPNGFFGDTIDVPNTEVFGFIIASTDNCVGDLAYGYGFYGMDEPTAFLDILYCDTSGVVPFDSCYTDVYCDPAGNLVANPLGTEPFTYLWNTGETTDFVTPLDTGFYCVTVTDADGCVSEGCSHWVGNGNGGLDSCVVFMYESTNGANVTSLVAGVFNNAITTYVWSTGETTESIQPLDDGIYCVTATDNSGCSATACYDYIANFWGQDSCGVYVSCDPNGVFIADAWGVAPFTYTWSTGETGPTISPVDAGDYCVTVTDAAGCVSEGCYFFDGSNPFDSCFAAVESDPQGNLIAYGFGVPPFTYLWHTGETSETIMVSDSSDYCLTITDATGCESVDCGTYVIDSLWSCTVAIIDNNGILEASIDNPQDYVFEWSTGETTQTITPSGSGLYCVVAHDLVGLCVAEACYFYLDDTADTTCTVSVVAFLDSTGLENLFAFGTGVEPFTYFWDNGETTPFITPNDDLAHCVVITDANGCVAVGCSDSNTSGVTSNNISGYIFTVDSTQFPVFVDGTVDLIDAASGAITATVDVVNLGGFPFYDFGDVADGNYLVRAMVSNPNGSSFIPTYHFATTLSGEADEIKVPYQRDPSFGVGFDILVFETVALAGKGSIKGNVTNEQKFADPTVGLRGEVEGLSIILFDNFDNPIDYFATDASGNFSFPELAYGTYKVYIDVPGHNNEYILVTIHDSAPDATNLSFDIEDGRISSNAGSSSANDLTTINEFRIFPNPTSGSVNIEITSAENRDMELRLQSISGATLSTQNVKLSKASQNVVLDLDNLNSGIYFVRLIDGDRSVAKKLMIK